MLVFLRALEAPLLCKLANLWLTFPSLALLLRSLALPLHRYTSLGMSLAWPTQYAPASFPATQLHASATAPPPPAPSSLPLSSALPPAPPARDLHSARIKFVLDKVRLELDAAREAVKEVCKLQEAVEGVREEVRVLKRGWDERGAFACFA